jgi:hypothetical protein
VSGFINSVDVMNIQKITKCKVIYTMMDMAPITGGCHYSHSCDGFKFNCQNCGSDKCYRPKISYGWTFLEGFYVCVNCKRKVTYCDNDFVIQTYNKQFELFKNDNN